MQVTSQSIRYAMTAGFCLVMHNLIIVVADAAGLGLFAAAACSFCIMVVLGYVLLSAWAFPTKRSWAGFLSYTFAMALNFPVNLGLLWLLHKLLAQPMLIAAPTATVLMAVINFFGSRYAILGREPRPGISGRAR